MMSFDFSMLEAGEATISEDRRYRYTLTRVWDKDKPRIAWIGLNPSTADEDTLDPTLRRVVRFSHDWGFGAFTMLNLFAFRATDPLAMKAAVDPIGPQNDSSICEVARNAATVVCAWGTHGGFGHRDFAVKQLLKAIRVKPVCLGTTAAGHPKHPLYLSSKLIPLVFPL